MSLFFAALVSAFTLFGCARLENEGIVILEEGIEKEVEEDLTRRKNSSF